MSTWNPPLAEAGGSETGHGGSRSSVRPDRGWAAFFRYHGVWAPGVRLFRRLGFPAKAAIISLAFMVPLIVLGTSFWRANAAQAEFVASERAGTRYARPLMALMVAITHERQWARRAARGDAAGELPRWRAEADAQWKALELVQREEGDRLRSAALWNEAQASWRLARGASTQDAATLLETYTHTLGRLEALLAWVADSSSLTLDPEIATYYLMDASVVAAPDLYVATGRLRALLSTAAREGSLNRGGWMAVQDDVQLIRRRLAQIQSALDKARQVEPEATRLLPLEALVRAVTTQVDGAHASLLAERPQTDAGTFTTQGDASADAVQAFMLQGVQVLDTLLAQRQSTIRRDSVAVGLLSVLSLAVAAYLLKAFYMVTKGGLDEVRLHLEAMTGGDLTTQPRPWGQDEAASLMRTLADMQHALRCLVQQVRSSADAIVHSSAEMADAARDLSGRTENAATHLQQSAASIEEISATVRHTAGHAQHAAELAQRNAAVAERGGAVIGGVVTTMRDIRGASGQIADIINVIDGIAFQTNILALNAAVEAARAGEQGRGFAVVASEVRALAQRSAAAAREIKSLITASVSRIGEGSQEVEAAGATMTDIVEHAGRINALVSDIARAAHEQTTGVSQVGQAMADLDRDAQQNASMVEESAASSQSLRQQALQLAEAVSTFRLPPA